MSSLNKVILIGNLGADPETRYMPSGDAMCALNIATSETWKDKTSGERKESTEWHRLVFFGRLAEVAGQYLRKGSKIYVEGRLKTRKWQKDGQDRYTTEIHVNDMKMLDGKPADGEQRAAPRQEQSRPAGAQHGSAHGGQGGFGNFDDDIPFMRVGSGGSWRSI